MKRQIYIIVVFLFFTSGCSEDAVLPGLPSDAVILAFGDSLTHGNGARSEESYPAVLAKLSGRRVINAGISGEETAAGLERLSGLLAEHQPQLMILCHGGNDFLHKKDPGKMEANVRAMINLARSEDIPVVLLGVPKPGLFLSSAEVYKKIAESSDVVFIENLVAEVLGDRSLKSDTVHPNKDGYRVMAENIHAVLGRVGAL